MIFLPKYLDVRILSINFALCLKEVNRSRNKKEDRNVENLSNYGEKARRG